MMSEVFRAQQRPQQIEEQRGRDHAAEDELEHQTRSQPTA
jgi:hypothetical protein